MTQEKAVIIIPTYNEALAIEQTLTHVFQETTAIRNIDTHILIFDSASTDNTCQIVKALQAHYPNLHLATEPKKSGLGSAYHQTMHIALNDLQADIIVEFDADLSHQPHYLPPMLELLTTHDVVVGSRYISGGSIPTDWAWHRKCLSVLGNLIARTLLTPIYQDFTSGFRLTRKKALRKALPKRFLSNQYAYKLELLWSLHCNKARIIEYPIVFIDRTQGESKLPTNSILDALRVLFTLRYQRIQGYLKTLRLDA